ncbi:hypothetical protein FB45DRAFT_1062490 [Roridomyces roridus]|uniref:F-box domain-containing protein n=1 Tax=Roridomyces roridus TaxID=1738132 RepID=A0AAD7FHC3_9AGAR|nr:hypothetical protein FB45DRAFT_1062490 [Roridomyces roridus]
MICVSCQCALPPDILPMLRENQALLDTLRSPYTPPDHRSHYLSAIADSTAALAQHDAAIAEVEAELQRMRCDRSIVQRYLDGCSAALAPVRKLPTEIWCNVFARLSVHWTEPHLQGTELKSLAKWNLLQVSLVCSRWYQIVVGTPALWCDIKMRGFQWPKDIQNQLFRSMLHLLKSSLQRASSHPLKIAMPWFYHTMSESVEQPVLQLLVNKSQQIIMSPADLHLLNLTPRIRGNLDLLEELTLDYGAATAGSADITVFEAAPKLTRVRLIQTVCCPRPPWSQLERLAVERVGLQHMKHLVAKIRHQVQLDQFDVATRVNPNYLLSVLPSTLICHMSSLVIEFDAPWTDVDIATPNLGRLFSCMTLPHVQTLSLLSHRRIPIRWPKSEFRALSMRSSFRDTLRVLEIPDISISTEELIHVLVDMASLERLVISDFWHRFHWEPPQNILITNALFRRLRQGRGVAPDSSLPRGDDRLVPRLKHLHCNTLFKFSAQAYFEFILSRIDSISTGPPFEVTLRRLGPATVGDLDPKTLGKLWDLVGQGKLRFGLLDPEFNHD